MANQIILCGKFEEMGKIFKETIQPEFEVTQFHTSPDAALSGITEALSSASPPAAIVVGATYDDAWIASVKGAAGSLPVPLLKPDVQGAAAATGGAGPGPEMAKMAAQRAKKTLAGLQAEGKLGKGDAGVVMY
ncbi:hypothetical protein F4780DRAFT_778392 [Xylariomycetidae sp. FL0641]|nr:hypothetical protein F4780DRAFT_778392 [Xylariomycetidae sp. FL0641]